MLLSPAAALTVLCWFLQVKHFFWSSIKQQNYDQVFNKICFLDIFIIKYWWFLGDFGRFQLKLCPCLFNECFIPDTVDHWADKRLVKNSDRNFCPVKVICSRFIFPQSDSQDTNPAIFETFVQHGVGRLVPSQGLFRQVLVGFCQTFHLRKTSVESHGRVTGVLGHIQVSCTPQLLLDHQSLLQQLCREVVETKKERMT